jgi:gamma-glutamylcyclotransferase (GGCT)/AIG2-like uncharacterized protein YtfP
MADERRFRIFAYGSLLSGELHHELLAGARHLGAVRTAPAYSLFELVGFPALVAGGTTSVAGELYEITATMRRRIDITKEHPIFFFRQAIRLEDGAEVEAYLMKADQVRARRRIKNGDWRRRFEPIPSGIPESPWRRWARERTAK